MLPQEATAVQGVEQEQEQVVAGLECMDPVPQAGTGQRVVPQAEAGEAHAHQRPFRIPEAQAALALQAISLFTSLDKP